MVSVLFINRQIYFPLPSVFSIVADKNIVQYPEQPLFDFVLIPELIHIFKCLDNRFSNQVFRFRFVLAQAVSKPGQRRSSCQHCPGHYFFSKIVIHRKYYFCRKVDFIRLILKYYTVHEMAMLTNTSFYRSLVLPGIIIWIHVINTPWAHSM